jgi:hypothetical protein
MDCFAGARNDGKHALEVALAVTVFIRYQLDPFKRAMFEQYSKRWLAIIPRCGGDLVGYWMPHEGTNNIAFALISFENLAAYEKAIVRGFAAMPMAWPISTLPRRTSSSSRRSGPSCARWRASVGRILAPNVARGYSRAK